MRRLSGWSRLQPGGPLTREHLAAPEFVMLFMLVIAVTAALFGRGPWLVASLLSATAYDFFFVPPFYTPWAADQRHLLTFGMMFAVGLVSSTITLHIRRQASDARTREEQTATLYSLSRDLSSALDRQQAALPVAQHASELLGEGAVVLLPDEQGAVSPSAMSGAELSFGARQMSAARWAFDHGRFAGRGTQPMPESRAIYLPLRSGPGAQSLGVLAFATGEQASLGIERRHFLEAFAQP
jgi:two-component system sensor histidine kinase KdpD